MCPITQFSFLAIGLAFVAAFFLGFIWYGPLFGKKWAQLAGVEMKEGGCNKPEPSAMVLTLLGTFLTVFSLAYLLGNGKFCCPMTVAFVVWLGFYLPLQLGSVAWERKPWQLLLLNASYSFISLQMVAAILTYVK